MNEVNLTQWFPGHVKPERIGVYERRFHKGSTMTHYSRWDGKTWLGSSTRPAGVSKTRQSAIWIALEWRGLAFDPQATGASHE